MVLELRELLESPDGLIGGADIAVGFGERAVQVLLETDWLLPHQQPPPHSRGPTPQAASVPESLGYTVPDLLVLGEDAAEVVWVSVCL